MLNLQFLNEQNDNLLQHTQRQNNSFQDLKPELYRNPTFFCNTLHQL